MTSAPRCQACRCTLINSPLATNVTGQMKDILTTALGMVIFGGRCSPWASGSADFAREARPGVARPCGSSLFAAARLLPWHAHPPAASRPTTSPNTHYRLAPADVKYSAFNVGGILLGLVGSVAYSAVSYAESKAPRQAAVNERDPPASMPLLRVTASRKGSGTLGRADSRGAQR